LFSALFHQESGMNCNISLFSHEFVLQIIKNTAFAALRQIITLLFDRISARHSQGLDSKSPPSSSNANDSAKPANSGQTVPSSPAPSSQSQNSNANATILTSPGPAIAQTANSIAKTPMKDGKSNAANVLLSPQTPNTNSQPASTSSTPAANVLTSPSGNEAHVRMSARNALSKFVCAGSVFGREGLGS
jgi:hypothetical protein